MLFVYSLNDDEASYSIDEVTDNSVTRLEIPDEYEGLPVTVFLADITSCENLKEFVAGNNLKEIGYGSLENASLERIYFKNSIETISGPLTDTVNLTDIFYEGTEEEWNNVEWSFISGSETVLEKIKKHFGISGSSVILSFGEEKIFPFTHWDCIKGKPEGIDAEKVFYDSNISGLDAFNVKTAIDNLNAKLFDATSLSSWEELLYLVRSGRASDFLKIGDQLISEKNGKELVWDVIGIDEDEPVDTRHKHSVTIQLRDCFSNLPFSVPEATCFATKKLSKGQYYLKMINYNLPPIYYAFTLEEDLPLGGLIRICENTVYLYKSRMENYYSSFGIDFSSAVEEDMVGTFLNQENYHIHGEMGTVNYEQSDIRKWLNSSESDWWYGSNNFSLAPLDYLSIAGFCNGMDEDFLKAINPVRKKTVLADGSEVITEDRFFLLSDEEVYASGEKPYRYYKDNSSLSGPSGVKDSSRIKLFESAPRHWWLRTSAPKDYGLTRVLTDGGVGYVKSVKVLAYGIAPACCIC